MLRSLGAAPGELPGDIDRSPDVRAPPSARIRAPGPLAGSNGPCQEASVSKSAAKRLTPLERARQNRGIMRFHAGRSGPAAAFAADLDIVLRIDD